MQCAGSAGPPPLTPASHKAVTPHPLPNHPGGVCPSGKIMGGGMLPHPPSAKMGSSRVFRRPAGAVRMLSGGSVRVRGLAELSWLPEFSGLWGGGPPGPCDQGGWGHPVSKILGRGVSPPAPLICGDPAARRSRNAASGSTTEPVVVGADSRRGSLGKKSGRYMGPVVPRLPHPPMLQRQ
jgi:hypothetical protein